MTKEQVLNRIRGVYKIVKEETIANGVKLVLDNGAIVNCFTTGKHNVQGKNVDEVKSLLDSDSSGSSASRKEIFIVYGHDEESLNNLELMLRRWGLEPIILNQKIPQGRTIIEALEHYINSVNYGIVLATPDDVGYRKGAENQKRYRVRQNVVFEFGMLVSRLGRSNVLVLLKNTKDLEMEKPSDISGLLYCEYETDVSECKDKIALSLRKCGYQLEGV